MGCYLLEHRPLVSGYSTEENDSPSRNNHQLLIVPWVGVEPHGPSFSCDKIWMNGTQSCAPVVQVNTTAMEFRNGEYVMYSGFLFAVYFSMLWLIHSFCLLFPNIP